MSFKERVLAAVPPGELVFVDAAIERTGLPRLRVWPALMLLVMAGGPLVLERRDGRQFVRRAPCSG